MFNIVVILICLTAGKKLLFAYCLYQTICIARRKTYTQIDFIISTNLQRRAVAKNNFIEK